MHVVGSLGRFVAFSADCSMSVPVALLKFGLAAALPGLDEMLELSRFGSGGE